MLAQSRQQHFFADSSIYNSNFGMNSFASYDAVHGYNLPYSIYENPSLFVEAPQDTYQNDGYESTSLSATFKSASHHSAELPPSTLSSTSTRSVPSAASSTIGSPYSNHGVSLSREESWATSYEGLGIEPTIVSHEGYHQGFDTDFSFGPLEKTTEDFVGECANLSSTQKDLAQSFSATAISQSPFPLQSTCPILSTSPETETIDTILERAKQTTTQARSNTPSPTDRRTQPMKSDSVFKSPTTPASARPRTPRTSSPIPVSRSGAAAAATAACTTQNSVAAQTGLSTAPLQAQPQAGHYNNHFFTQSSGSCMPPLESSYPSLIQAPRATMLDPPSTYPESFAALPAAYGAMSPAASPAASYHDLNYQQQQPYSQPSPSYAQNPSYPPFHQQFSFEQRRDSIASFHSKHSASSPYSTTSQPDEDSSDKGRCPNPDCGRVFKDLRAHMLTHQSERPEKCPILNCEYNQKGFARKYDKNRHTLTHYKGTMVCGFCPGSGSAAEKSFNRADVFKRHLTSVHSVEQTPPNSRKRSPSGNTKRGGLSSYCEDATGKCSTCSATFNNAQEFYEHLDDCVLRVVQQEEPSEAYNARHLGNIAQDADVKETMERHMLGTEESSFETTSTATAEADAEEEEEVEEEDEDEEHTTTTTASTNTRSGRGTLALAHKSARLAGARAVIGAAVTKPTTNKSNRNKAPGLTHSRGGVPLLGRGRKKRKHYPPAWGLAADKMSMKKRVLCVYDGERRLWKDDLMMHNEFEVRVPLLPDGHGRAAGAYVTDLDVETLKRAEGFHTASGEERGEWVGDEQGGRLGEIDLETLMA